MYTRKEVDDICQRKTEDWVRAVTTKDGLYFIDESVIEKITTHKKGGLWQVMAHEMNHWYFGHITNTSNGRPKWFTEGLAQVMAGQVLSRPKQTRELITKKYFSFAEGETYNWGNLMAKTLIDKYGRDKTIRLVKKIGPKMTEKEFSNYFKEIFGLELIDFENEVKEMLDKTLRGNI